MLRLPRCPSSSHTQSNGSKTRRKSPLSFPSLGVYFVFRECGRQYPITPAFVSSSRAKRCNHSFLLFALFASYLSFLSVSYDRRSFKQRDKHESFFPKSLEVMLIIAMLELLVHARMFHSGWHVHPLHVVIS